MILILRKAWLLAGTLAVIAGLLGMHVLTAGHTAVAHSAVGDHVPATCSVSCPGGRGAVRPVGSGRTGDGFPAPGNPGRLSSAANSQQSRPCLRLRATQPDTLRPVHQPDVNRTAPHITAQFHYIPEGQP